MTATVQHQVDRSAGVTAPAGFRAAGVIAGIKPAGKPDLTVVVNDGPYDVAAGVFTTNKVKAAPVLWSQQVLTAGRLKAGEAGGCPRRRCGGDRRLFDRPDRRTASDGQAAARYRSVCGRARLHRR